MHRGRARSECHLDVVHDRERLVVDADQRHRVRGGGVIDGRHSRNRIADAPHLVGTQRGLILQNDAVAVEALDVVRRDDCGHAKQYLGRRHVDRDDSRMSNIRPQDAGHQHTRLAMVGQIAEPAENLVLDVRSQAPAIGQRRPRDFYLGRTWDRGRHEALDRGGLAQGLDCLRATKFGDESIGGSGFAIPRAAMLIRGRFDLLDQGLAQRQPIDGFDALAAKDRACAVEELRRCGAAAHREPGIADPFVGIEREHACGADHARREAPPQADLAMRRAMLCWHRRQRDRHEQPASIEPQPQIVPQRQADRHALVEDFDRRRKRQQRRNETAGSGRDVSADGCELAHPGRGDRSDRSGQQRPSPAQHRVSFKLGKPARGADADAAALGFNDSGEVGQRCDVDEAGGRDLAPAPLELQRRRAGNEARAAAVITREIGCLLQRPCAHGVWRDSAVLAHRPGAVTLSRRYIVTRSPCRPRRCHIEVPSPSASADR